MTQTEEHLTGDGIQVQDDISLRFVQQRLGCGIWQRFFWQPVALLEQLPLRCRCFRRFTTERN